MSAFEINHTLDTVSEVEMRVKSLSVSPMIALSAGTKLYT